MTAKAIARPFSDQVTSAKGAIRNAEALYNQLLALEADSDEATDLTTREFYLLRCNMLNVIDVLLAALVKEE